MRTLRAVWRSSLALLLLTLVLGIVLLAVYASLGRLLMPRLAAQQPAIEQWLGEQLPFPMRFETLQGSWLRLSPSLVLTAVQAEVPVRGTLWQFSAQRVAVEIDVLRSLYYRQLQLGDVSLQGAALHMQGQPLDLFRGSAEGRATALQPSTVMVWVMNLGFVSVQDAHLLLDIPGLERPLQLTLDMALERQGDFRRLRLGMRFGEADDSGRLEAVAEARQSMDGGLAALHAYAGLDHFELNHWLQGMAWAGAVPQLAEAFSARLWAHWVPGAEVRVRGQLQSPRLAWDGMDAVALPVLDEFSSEFLLTRDRNQHWRLDVPVIDFLTAGVASPFAGLQLGYRPGQPWQLGLAELDLPVVQAWLQATGLLPAGLHDVLASLAPQGRLQPAVVTLARAQGQWQWRLHARAESLAVSPWHGAPGLSGISGYLQADAGGGFVDLDSQAFSMAFPLVYDAPMHFSGARARVGWQIEAGRVTVSSSRIDLDSPAHGPAHGLLALSLPLHHGDDAVPWMSLLVSLQDAPAAVREAYIPALLAPELKDWLAHSIGSGRVSRGGFIFDGPLVNRGARKPVIQLYLDVHEAALDYHPQWPALSAVDGRLLLDDRAVTVWASRGRVYDSWLGATRVDVRDDAEGALRLWVDGQLHGPAADVLRLLRESPVRTALGGAFDDWQASGDYQGRLALVAPLVGSAAPQVQVDARLRAVDIRLADLDLAFERVQGPLQYDSRSGLQSPGLDAYLWQQPLAVRIESRHETDGYHTGIQASGAVALAAVKDWLGWPWLHFAEGMTAVEANLQVRPGQAPWLELDSTLQGVAVTLPPPYRKVADAAWPFRAVIPLAAEALMDFRIGPALRVGVLRQDGAAAQTVIALGQTGMPLPQQPGVTLQGRLPEFDWHIWQPSIERLIADFSAMETPVGPDPEATTGAAAFRIGGVYIDTFRLLGQSFSQVMVDVRHEQRWWLGVRSQDLMGRVGLPLQAGEPYLAQIERLRLPEGLFGGEATLAEADADTGAAFSLATLDWGDWPPIQIDLGRLEVGALDLGRWRLQVLPTADSLTIERLRVDSSLLRVDAEGGGAWLRWTRPADGPEMTAVHGNLLLRDVARVFQALGIDPGISAQEGVLGLHLNWPGHPLAAERARIAGQVGLRFSSGVIRTDRKAEEGLLKALGFFNLDRILRRIQLDFSDLAADGLVFDTARSKVSFADGWLTLDEPVEVRGVSSHFFLEGRMDIANDRLENRLIVTLPVSSSLPWLAALAGGLPAAAGVYIVSKLVDTQVDRFTSLEYEVSGSSTDPQVRFRKLFDVGALWPAWAGGREAAPKAVPSADPAVQP